MGSPIRNREQIPYVLRKSVASIPESDVRYCWRDSERRTAGNRCLNLICPRTWQFTAAKGKRNSLPASMRSGHKNANLRVLVCIEKKRSSFGSDH